MYRLKQFPYLQSVALVFDPMCRAPNSVLDMLISQPPEFRVPVMQGFMSSLGALPNLLRDLAIYELQNMNETLPVTVAARNKLLGGLESLRLNICNESDTMGDLGDYQWNEMHVFLSELPAVWLRPTMSGLRHLTLYSSHYFGFYPKLDLSGIHFPQLKTLCLGHYAFMHDPRLDWILSHGPTISELYLDNCAIIYAASLKQHAKEAYLPQKDFTDIDNQVEYAAYDKRWHHCFDAFRDGLPHLRYFCYVYSEDWSSEEWSEDLTPFECETEMESEMFEMSYMAVDGPWYDKELDFNWTNAPELPDTATPPSCIEEDREALRRLLEAMGQYLG